MANDHARTDRAARIEDDAKGQFARPMRHSKASGVASAKPTVITGCEDATAHRTPTDRKKHKDGDPEDGNGAR
ncbi:hypothetical protein [Ensifer soli]|uniref:hypothetical protein n=1 Tax=Ciceribacter sp. sgz301302 TaxID=3342379 RepID=UPI0035B88539